LQQSNKHKKMKQVLKKFIPGALLNMRKERINAYYKKNPDKWRIDNWKQNGYPAPPPAEVKRMLIEHYQNFYKMPAFIETGTFQGDTTAYVQPSFDHVITIELSNELHNAAVERFKSQKNIECLLGDSGEVLGQIMDRDDRSFLFWLDGHFSEGITAKADLETPIIKEMEHIHRQVNRTGKQHIILIDDARCFDGTHDYPPLENFKTIVLKMFPEYQFYVLHDIIFIVPKGPTPSELSF